MSKFFNLLSILALLAALFGSAVTYTPAHAQGVVWYVKPSATGNGDCSSWANACTLQTALTSPLLASGHQIWVQEGPHKPHDSDRAASFKLKNGVAVYGGFAGGETQLSERNPAQNVTILSGDIGTPNDASDNSYHVVVGSNTNNTAILDGFTVSGGNANGSSPHNVGGGMFNSISSATLSELIFFGNSSAEGGGAMYNQDGSNLKLTKVTFSENSSKYGGGMNNFKSSPTLKNVIFSGNSASNAGGGISNYSSNPTLTDVTFSGNFASTYGGGINNNISSPILTNVTFSGNQAPYGGGMFNTNLSNLALKTVTFSGNEASAGGGMFNTNGSSQMLTNVTFSGNSATNVGGGIYNENGSNPTLTNATFSANTATNEGGGIYNGNSSPTLTKVTFSGNAANNGGGMYSANGSNPTVTNVTFNANTANRDGGGIYNTGSSNPTVTNVTFNANTANRDGGGIFSGDSSPKLTNATLRANTANRNGGGMYTTNGGPPLRNVTFSGNSAGSGGGMYYDASNVNLVNVIIANSAAGGDCINNAGLATSALNNLIEDAASACGITNGPRGNIVGMDPKLNALANNGGFTKTMALKNGSPAIDSGRDVGCPPKDQRGVKRPQRDHCDMGAYEAPYISGDLDTTFSRDGQVITSVTPAWPEVEHLNSIAIQADRKIVAAGHSKGNFALVRYHANGTLDKTFSGDGKLMTNLGGVEIAYDVAVQPDGKIIAVGEKCTNLGPPCDLALIRYNADGTPDATFNGNGQAVLNYPKGDNGANSLALQPDGKIIVAGYTIKGTDRNFAIYRFNPNGSLDKTFSGDGDGVAIGNFGPGMQDFIYDLEIQSDGKIVFAGSTVDESGNSDFAIARLNPDGTADPTFSRDARQITDFGANDSAYGLALQPDGKIIVVGERCTAPFTCSVAMARYKANGALDPTFSGTGKKVFVFGPGDYSSARGVIVTPKGKIVVTGAAAGNFGLVRLLSTSAFDASFSGDGKVLIDFGGDDDAHGIAAQPTDGRYVLGGFTTLGGDFALVRILP